MKQVFRFILALVLIVVMGSVAFAETKVRVAGYGGSDLAIVEELIAKFVNPALKDEGITVVYEPIADDYQRYIVNALSAGTGPDLFYIDAFWAESLIRSGAVEPLDEYLAKSKVLHKEDIIPSLLDAFTVDGKVYGIPKDFNTLALFYNKDLFDLAGVPYPDENDTWDTLEEKLRKVAELDDEIYGLALQPEFARMGALAFAAGFEPFDKNGKTNLFDPGFREAFEWYVGLAKKGIGVMPADLGQGWGGGAFATERVAACLEGAWIIGFLRDNAPNLNYGVTLLPKHPKTGKRGNFIYTVAWGINRDSNKKEAAFKVLEILTSEEVQQWVLERGLAIPSRVALADNPYFKKNDREAYANYIVFKGASDGNVKPFNFRQYGGEWMAPINEVLRSVMSGEYTVEQGLKEAQKRIEQVMRR
ncbi:ABC transporter substrate-binding protein [Anoxybacter fermentans]|uniref:ABC transporter substrate-binding protein n=1 Tax=Anoxybacter fermentans TaxID=1323375 RepID=A0A3Q9HSR6_9FIRM|nr:ABC transporter substrate-binding protein [Anoxybacter fermentans]AZR74455.1 ABC transporter substrate-binding protein [Anoxybacter fermentans]